MDQVLRDGASLVARERGVGALGRRHSRARSSRMYQTRCLHSQFNRLKDEYMDSKASERKLILKLDEIKIELVEMSMCDAPLRTRATPPTHSHQQHENLAVLRALQAKGWLLLCV